MWLCWLFYFQFKKLKGKSYFLSQRVCSFPTYEKICILKKQATEVILVGWFSKCQSIKKVSGRRFIKGLYHVLFSFRFVNNIPAGQGKMRLTKIFDHWGDVLICLLINTSAPSHWLKSVAWSAGPVLKFRDIPDCLCHLSTRAEKRASKMLRSLKHSSSERKLKPCNSKYHESQQFSKLSTFQIHVSS